MTHDLLSGTFWAPDSAWILSGAQRSGASHWAELSVHRQWWQNKKRHPLVESVAPLPEDRVLKPRRHPEEKPRRRPWRHREPVQLPFQSRRVLRGRRDERLGRHSVMGCVSSGVAREQAHDRHLVAIETADYAAHHVDSPLTGDRLTCLETVKMAISISTTTTTGLQRNDTALRASRAWQARHY
jgi:hypothetical protein